MPYTKGQATALLIGLFLIDLVIPVVPFAAVLLLVTMFYEPARKNLISILTVLGEDSK